MRGVATPPRAVMAFAPPPSPSPQPSVLTTSASLAGLLAGGNVPSTTFQPGSVRAGGSFKMPIMSPGGDHANLGGVHLANGPVTPSTAQGSLGMGNRGGGSLRCVLHTRPSRDSYIPPASPSTCSCSRPTSTQSIASSVRVAPVEPPLVETKYEGVDARDTGVVGLQNVVQRLEAEIAQLSASEAAKQQVLVECQRLLASEEQAASLREVQAEEEQETEAFRSRANGGIALDRLPTQRTAPPAAVVPSSAGQRTPPQSRVLVDLLPPNAVSTAPAMSTPRTALAGSVPVLIPAPSVRAPVRGPCRGLSRNTSFETSPGNSTEALPPGPSRGRQRGTRSLSPTGGNRISSVPPYPPCTWMVGPSASSPGFSSVPLALSACSSPRPSRPDFHGVLNSSVSVSVSSARLPQQQSAVAPPNLRLRSRTPPQQSVVTPPSLRPRSQTPPPEANFRSLEACPGFKSSGSVLLPAPSPRAVTVGRSTATPSSPARDITPPRRRTTQPVIVGTSAAASSSPSRNASPTRGHVRKVGTPPCTVPPQSVTSYPPFKCSPVAPVSSHGETTWRSQPVLSAVLPTPAKLALFSSTAQIYPTGSSTSASTCVSSSPALRSVAELISPPTAVAGFDMRRAAAKGSAVRFVNIGDGNVTMYMENEGGRGTEFFIDDDLPSDLSELLERSGAVPSSCTEANDNVSLQKSLPLHSMSQNTTIEDFPLSEKTTSPESPVLPPSLGLRPHDAGSLAKHAPNNKSRQDEVVPSRYLQPISAVAEKVQQLRQYFEAQKQVAISKALQASTEAPTQASRLTNGKAPLYASSGYGVHVGSGELHGTEDGAEDNVEADEAYAGEVFLRMTQQLEVLEEILEVALVGHTSVPPSNVEAV